MAAGVRLQQVKAAVGVRLQQGRGCSGGEAAGHMASVARKQRAPSQPANFLLFTESRSPVH